MGFLFPVLFIWKQTVVFMQGAKMDFYSYKYKKKSLFTLRTDTLQRLLEKVGRLQDFTGFDIIFALYPPSFMLSLADASLPMCLDFL